MSPGIELRNAKLWSLTGTAAQQAINFVLFVVLARLLTPHDFGQVALAAAGLDILLVLARAGIAECLIQQRDTPDQTTCSTAFWLAAGLGVGLAALLALLAQPVAQFYGDPQLTPLIMLLALTCAGNGFGLVHEALIKREMGFRALSLRLTAATAIAGAIAIAGALTGFGLYALVIQRLALSLALLLLAWRAVAWRPRWMFSHQIAHALLAKGLHLSAGALLTMTNFRLLDAVIAYAHGAAVLGQFRLAWRIMDMMVAVTITPLAAVALTAFSRATASDDTITPLLGSTRTGLLLCGLPVALVAALASDLVPTVFGVQWQLAADLLPIIALVPIVYAISQFAEAALIAKGNFPALTRIGMVNLGFTGVVTVLLAPFGPAAIALSQLARATLAAGVSLALLSPRPGYIQSLRAMTAPVLAVVATVAAVTAAAPLTAPLPPLARLLLLIPAGTLVYGATLALVVRQTLRDAVTAIKQVKRRKRS